MSFANQFATYFTAQQREAELYQLWATIGANAEKAILEEQNKLNAEFTDINNFSEDTLRSWLAFFLMRIPYRTSATVQVSTSLNGEYLQTDIPQYAELQTDDGITYTLMESVTLCKGDERIVTAVQGVRVVETGTYSSLIKLQATDPDLNYMTVKINGQEIPEVSFETSYDQLLYRGTWKPQLEEGHEFGGTPFLQNAYGNKGEFYVVIADGDARFADKGIVEEFRTGDVVVYDGYSWQKSTSNNNLTPVQYANSYALPRNGYFAYYYDGYLYVKIFSGSDVEDPNGQQYEISYIQSDGVQGEIEANTLKYVSEYEDKDENPVELTVSNTKSTPAINQPSKGKLGVYLKQRLYCSINIASVPEYEMWFKAQQEVGDCLVLSDYEKYVRGGRKQLNVTGIVDVYLVDPNGNALTTATKETLLDRIEPYKDIAVLQISEFVEVQQFLKFEYTTATSTESFEQFVIAKANQYYNLSYLQATNSSLFSDLDLTAIIKDILDTSPYDSTGLVVHGYHYKNIPVTTSTVTFDGYEGEKAGNGYYLLNITPPYKGVSQFKMYEVPNAGDEGSATIYYDNPDEGQPVAVGSHIIRETNEQTAETGTSSNNVLLQINKLGIEFVEAQLDCFMGMSNPGMLSIGTENGLRKLHGAEIERLTLQSTKLIENSGE